MSKLAGAKVIKTYGDFDILATDKPAKRTGKNRVWFRIQLKESKSNKWRIYATLSYARAIDIQFEQEK